MYNFEHRTGLKV